MRLKNKDVKKPLEGMSVEWLASECKAPVDLLWKLARDTSVMYKPTRPQKKKCGVGYREIDPPKKEYKRLLRRIAKVLSLNIKHHPAAHGGVLGRSSFTGAKPHCGAKFIVTRDIEDCYPSISPEKLFDAFIKLGATSEFAKFLSSIMTVHSRIPQGGPPSSEALNLYFLRMDDHFYRKAKATSGNYRRLSDDFVISVKRHNTALRLENELDHSIRHRNLKINERKRREKGLLGGDRLKVIHSLVVNSRRGLKPKEEHIDKGLKIAEHYARCCRCAKPTDLHFLADLRQHVTGWMYYFRQADFSPASHIRRMLENADGKVLGMLLRNGLHPHKNKWWVVHRARNEHLRLLGIWEERKSSRCPA